MRNTRLKIDVGPAANKNPKFLVLYLQAHNIKRLSKLNFICFFILLSVMACRSPYDADINGSADNYRIISIFTPGQPIVATIGKIIAPTDPEKYITKEEFTIELIQENLNYTFRPGVFPVSREPLYKLDQWQIDQNLPFKVLVSKNNNYVMSADLSIPSKTVEFSGVQISDKSLLQNAFQTVHISLNVHDPQDEVNYYHLIFHKINYKNDGNGKYVPDGSKPKETLEILPLVAHQAYDEIYLSHEPGILFSDAGFPNSEMQLQYQLKTTHTIKPSEEIFKEIQIELRHISKEYYLYQKNIDLQFKAKNQDIPLYEPITSYTNVKDGQGIVCAYRTYFELAEF